MLNKLLPKPEKTSSKWIAHFGGSFNPVHDGHLEIAKVLLDKYNFDRIVFCPNGDNYNKSGLAPEKDRFALVKIAVKSESRIKVIDFELNSDRVINTLETIQYLYHELSNEFDDFRLFCIRGADAVDAFKTWRSIPALCELSTIIVVPRKNINLDILFEETKSLNDKIDSFKILNSEDIPDISSTSVRRAVYKKNTKNLPVPKSVKTKIFYRGMYGTAKPGEEWITLYRPGYSGKTGKLQDKERDKIYGKNNWRTAFKWGNKILTYNDALQLYEDAYFEHFKNNPDDLDWIVKTAYDVYDNSDSNVFSGLDYSIQESTSTHLQDIAVRRSLMRFGLDFQGDHFVEIREKDSEGYRLNPGQLKFHIPEKIIEPEPQSWWNSGSVESFWQSNKVFQVKERVFSEDLKLFFHLIFVKDKKMIIARTVDGRIKELPFILFKQGKDFQKVMETGLKEWECSLNSFSFVMVEPQIIEDSVHIALKSTKVLKELPSDFEYFNLQQVLSSRISIGAKHLLKKVNKSGVLGR